MQLQKQSTYRRVTPLVRLALNSLTLGPLQMQTISSGRTGSLWHLQPFGGMFPCMKAPSPILQCLKPAVMLFLSSSPRRNSWDQVTNTWRSSKNNRQVVLRILFSICPEKNPTTFKKFSVSLLFGRHFSSSCTNTCFLAELRLSCEPEMRPV